MQKKVIRYLVLCFFIFINNVLLCTEKTSNKNSRIKINISTSFQCDIGLLLGYMLEVYNLNNNMINQRTFNRLLKLKKEVNSEKRTKLENHNKLLKILDERPYLERLLQVPILFDSFSNTKTAYDLILGIEKINKQNRGIYNILNNTIFLVSPQLQRLTGSDKEAARLLIEGITEEYKNLKNKPYFFQEFADNKEIEDYEEELENKFHKAIKAVDFNNSFE
ncbi:MAG: hypothetical protein K9L78_02330, partial [Victivallales bacterium]|nr:hypothetical protein [Victivallales bacterium]